MENWILWLIIATILVIVEASMISLVFIWFFISAILAAFVSVYIDSFFIQFSIFVIGGSILLLLTKPLLKNYTKKDNVSVNLDRIIGMVGVVTEQIKKNAVGEVKVDGKKWSAVSSSTINKGEEVMVEHIEGVKIIVKKVNK